MKRVHQKSLDAGTALVLTLVAGLASADLTRAETIQARPAVVRGNVWHLRDTLTSGFADAVFSYGRAGDHFLMGDWDGDGLKTPGVVRGNTWYLRNSNSSGFADIVLKYGSATDIPIAGDWDGDGTDTVGVAREHVTPFATGENTWHLRNSSTSGFADINFAFSFPGTPIVGDWNGDGSDGVGMRPDNTNRFELDDDLDGTEDVQLFYGSPSFVPIAGDWDGDEDETIGAVGESGTWFLKNENTTGMSDTHFRYGSWTDAVFLIWGVAPG